MSENKPLPWLEDIINVDLIKDIVNRNHICSKAALDAEDLIVKIRERFSAERPYVKAIATPKEGVVLACGSGRYTIAIVASVKPFILISTDGGMMWQKMNQSDFTYDGECSNRVWESVQGRLSSEGHVTELQSFATELQPQEEITVKCDLIDELTALLYDMDDSGPAYNVDWTQIANLLAQLQAVKRVNKTDWISRKSTSDLKSKISYLEDNIDKMRVEKNNLKAHLRHVSKLNYESHVELERFKKEECEVTNALKVISKIMLGKGD